MAKVKGAIVVERERCKGCAVCVSACPSNVINMSRDLNTKGYMVAFMEKPNECTGCANCAIVCPDSVISVYRKKFEDAVV
jgi:2-oxoglutarate ferredoxin oxidoreductase subunit delta